MTTRLWCSVFRVEEDGSRSIKKEKHEEEEKEKVENKTTELPARELDSFKVGFNSTCSKH